jgi:hypothetical protein
MLELYFWGEDGSGALPPALHEDKPNFRIVRWEARARAARTIHVSCCPH